jgi:hypothetical protein
MSDLLKMDIFFVVTTIAVVLLTLLVAIALYYVIRLLRTLDRIGEQIEEEAAALRADLNEVRSSAKKQGLKIKELATFFDRTAKRLLGKKRSR